MIRKSCILLLWNIFRVVPPFFTVDGGRGVIGSNGFLSVTPQSTELIMAEIKINGLTLEQEKAANLLATGIKMSEKQVAKAVCVSVSVLNDWKSDARFKVRVLQIFDENVDLERTKRYNKVNNYLKPVYKEIRARLREDGALENIPLKELLTMMSRLHQELRSDANSSKSFLNAGIKEFGEEVSSDQKVDKEDDVISKISSNYEAERKASLSKKVVRLKA